MVFARALLFLLSLLTIGASATQASPFCTWAFRSGLVAPVTLSGYNPDRKCFENVHKLVGQLKDRADFDLREARVLFISNYFYKKISNQREGEVAKWADHVVLEYRGYILDPDLSVVESGTRFVPLRSVQDYFSGQEMLRAEHLQKNIGGEIWDYLPSRLLVVKALDYLMDYPTQSYPAYKDQLFENEGFDRLDPYSPIFHDYTPIPLDTYLQRKK